MVALAAAVGVLPAVAGVAGALAVSTLGLAVLGLAFLRRALRGVVNDAASDGGHSNEREAPAATEPHHGVPSVDLRVSRWLFYLAVVSIGEASFRPALGLTVSEALFIASFVSCVIAVLRGHTIVVLPVWVLAGVLVFSFGGLISSIGSGSPTGSGFVVLHAVYVMLLWVWTGAMVLRTRRHFLVAMTLWGISIAIDGVAAITQVFGANPLAQSAQGNRMPGLTEHPNDLGGAASIALVPALLLATWTFGVQSAAVRTLRWMPVILIAVAVVLSGSVAGMAGAALAILMWIALPFVRAPARVAVVGVLGAALLATSLAGGRAATPVQRLELVTSPANARPGAGSGQTRLSVVKATWPAIESSPFVGKGLDATVTVITAGYPAPYQIHGAPLALWYEAGLFGLMGVLVLFAACVRAGWQSVRVSANQEDVLIGWALIAALAAFLVYAMTAPFVYQQYGWFAFVMVVAWRLRHDVQSRAIARITVSRLSTGPPLVRGAWTRG